MGGSSYSFPDQDIKNLEQRATAALEMRWTPIIGQRIG
jgi:hypothetical protein